ncbi:unnamed protein product, partial [Brassica rapa subsp. trilocularis]
QSCGGPLALTATNLKRQGSTFNRVNSYSLSLDLMIEIFKRLPLKTLIRSLCVSKQWASIIRGRYFMKLFLNESLTRPKSVVFVFRKRYDGLSYSEVSLKIAHELVPSSSDAASSLATYHVTVHTLQRTKISPSVHGLICYGPPSELIVYNPCTRRSATLPKVNAGRRAINHYLGYDPINNDYKVLCIIRDPCKEEWSKKTFVLPAAVTAKHFHRFQTTATDTGEIIDTPIHEHASQTSFVYFDFKNDSVRNFNIEGITDEYMFCQSDFVSAGQVENLMFL